MGNPSQSYGASLAIWDHTVEGGVLAKGPSPPARRSGERYKIPQWGSGSCPGRQEFWCILGSSGELSGTNLLKIYHVQCIPHCNTVLVDTGKNCFTTKFVSQLCEKSHFYYRCLFTSIYKVKVVSRRGC